MPTGVSVRDNESFEQALRRFKRKCEKAGILSEVKRRRFYEKPSERRKREMIQARKKMLRKMAKQRRAGLLARLGTAVQRQQVPPPRDGHAEALVSTLELARERVVRVGAGYREDLFFTEDEVEPSSLSIVYAGKYSRAKGLPWLLDAIEILAERFGEETVGVLQVGRQAGGVPDEARFAGRDDVGATLIDVLVRYADSLHEVGSRLILASVEPGVRRQLDATGVTDAIGTDNIYDPGRWRTDALLHAHADAQAWIEARTGTNP